MDALRTSSHGGCVIRSVNLRRWEVSWKAADGTLYEASVRYRRPRPTLEEDSNLEQLMALCESGLVSGGGLGSERSGEHSAPPLSLEAPLSRERRATLRTPKARVEGVHQTSQRSQMRSTSSLPPAVAFLLILCGVTGATIFILCSWQTKVLADELLTHRVRIESALTARLDDKLAQGDYGEVQAELDALLALEYFDGAVVTNTQQRVIALAGRVTGSRIGSPVTSTAGAKVIPLGVPNRPGSGQAITWGRPDLREAAIALLRQLLALGAGLSITTAVGAALVWTRDRRQRIGTVNAQGNR